MSQISSNIRSFHELSHRYAELIGKETRGRVHSLQRKIADLKKDHDLDNRIEALKGELAEVNKRGRKVIAELSRLKHKVGGEIKNKISRA